MFRYIMHLIQLYLIVLKQLEHLVHLVHENKNWFFSFHCPGSCIFKCVNLFRVNGPWVCLVFLINYVWLAVKAYDGNVMKISYKHTNKSTHEHMQPNLDKQRETVNLGYSCRACSLTLRKKRKTMQEETTRVRGCELWRIKLWRLN